MKLDFNVPPLNERSGQIKLTKKPLYIKNKATLAVFATVGNSGATGIHVNYFRKR
jgi:hypothetical protein